MGILKFLLGLNREQPFWNPTYIEAIYFATGLIYCSLLAAQALYSYRAGYSAKRSLARFALAVIRYTCGSGLLCLGSRTLASNRKPPRFSPPFPCLGSSNFALFEIRVRIQSHGLVRELNIYSVGYINTSDECSGRFIFVYVSCFNGLGLVYIVYA